MTLRARVLVTIVGLLILSVVGLAVVLTLSARDSFRAQAQTGALSLAQSVLDAIVVLNSIPDQVENKLGQQMQIQARIAAEYVAAAERAGDSPAEINQRLSAIANESDIDEFWVTDETGHAYLSNIHTEFTFNPDPAVQPQAHVFWPLLTGEAIAVQQKGRVREIDNNLYKYVGVAGVDQSRIVQVGSRQELIEQIRARTGVQAFLDGIVQDGNVAGMWMLDSQFHFVAGAEHDESSAIRRTEVTRDQLIRAREVAEPDEAGLLQAKSFFQSRPGAAEAASDGSIADWLLEQITTGAGFLGRADFLDVYAPVASSTGELLSVVIIRVPTESLQSMLVDGVTEAFKVAIIIIIIATVLSIELSRRITDPVRVIGEAARAVEAGREPSPELTAVAQRRGEIGHLAEVFGVMAREVREREKRLDYLVKQRTSELEKSNTDLQHANSIMSQDLEMARALQISIVESNVPASPLCSVHGYMKTAREVGGDFYEAFQLASDRVALGIADVSGKGAAAALFMAAAKPTLAQAVREIDSGGSLREAVEVANRNLCAWNSMSYFVTVFIAVFDAKTGVIDYVNAGHEAPYVIHADGSLGRLEGQTGLALGIEGSVSYPEVNAQLQPGDRLFLFTDGFTEAMDTEGVWFGHEKLEDTLRKSTGQASDVKTFVDGILDDLGQFTEGAEQSDDITCLTMHYVSGEGSESERKAA